MNGDPTVELAVEAAPKEPDDVPGQPATKRSETHPKKTNCKWLYYELCRWLDA